MATHGQGKETVNVFLCFNLLHIEGFILSSLLLLFFSAERYPMAKLLKAHRWAAKTRYGFPEKSSVQGGLGRVSYGWPESQFGSLGWILLWTFVCIGNRLKRKHGQRKEKWERPTYVDQMRAWNEWTETHSVGPLPSAFWLGGIVKLLFFIKLLFIKLLFFMIFI